MVKKAERSIAATKREEEFLLRSTRVDLDATVSQRIVFGISGFIISLVPVYLYTTIFGMSVESYGVLFAVVSLLLSVALNFAFHNVTLWLRSRLLGARQFDFEPALSGKKNTDSLRKEQEALTLRQSIAYSILYNSVLYLLSVVTLAFLIFQSTSGPYNYVLSSTFALLTVSVASVNNRRQ